MGPEETLGFLAALLNIFSIKGMPTKITFKDGTELTDLTIEELDSLKVKKMSEKREG